jgi:hypothetical protein
MMENLSVMIPNSKSINSLKQDTSLPVACHLFVHWKFVILEGGMGVTIMGYHVEFMG